MRVLFCILLCVTAFLVCSDVARSQDTIEWMASYEASLERARIERKPVMVYFYATWCYYCKLLDTKTLPDPEIIRLSKDFVCVRINSDRHRDLARRYRITANPIIVYLSRDGLETTRTYGYQPPSAFKITLRQILEDKSRLEELSEEYKKDSSNSEKAYLYADELMAKGLFADAEKVLEKMLSGKPKVKVEESRLALGLCRFNQGDFKKASDDLAKFSSTYKESPRSDEAKLYLGMSLAELGKKEEALRLLDELGRRISGSWVGQQAQRKALAYRKGPAE